MRGPSERLRAAAKEHDQLLTRIARRRKALEQLEQEIRVAMTQVASQMGPLVEEARRLDEEIHAMMERLTGDGSRPRRERAEIERLYRELQEGGIVSPRGFWAGVEGGADRATGPSECDSDDDNLAPPSAIRPKAGDRGVLRGLFRRLAEALHPDKVQDEQAKAHHTAVMKQITVAYHEGDYARLVEIERAWTSSGGAPTAGDAEHEVERRFAIMEQANAELRKQLQAIEREVRGLRRSAEGLLAVDVKRRREGGEALGMISEVEQVEQELETLRRICDFVRRFRDGEISLATFLDGPDAEEDADDIDLTDALATLVMLMQEEGVGVEPRRDRRGGKTARAKTRRRRA